MPKQRRRINEGTSDSRGRFRRFILSNAQWEEVAKHSGLSATARRRINNLISNYRGFETTEALRIPPAKIRDEFRAVRKATLKLLHRLTQLMENPDAHYVLTSAPEGQGFSNGFQRPTRLNAHLGLCRVVAELKHLADWLEIASGRVAGKRRGPNTGNLYWLVAQLDVVRIEFTGKKISRSYKDDSSKNYIAAVCRIADPDVGDGTIVAAMKDRIARCGRNSD